VIERVPDREAPNEKDSTMEAIEIVKQAGVQMDASNGQGHCWRDVTDDHYESIVEEIATWVLEDRPESGDQMRASDGQYYRVA